MPIRAFSVFFDFELLKGDKKTSLSMPGQVVITERIARKYFKEEDPVGKILIFTGPYYKISCEVTESWRKCLPIPIYIITS